MPDASNHPTVTGVLETSLYVADLDRSRQFYTALFGFPQLAGDARFCALDVVGRQVLLLFRHGASLAAAKTSGGILPPHDGSGQMHLAFAIAAQQWEAWLARLESTGIAIESIINWPRGGRSVYFRDPGCASRRTGHARMLADVLTAFSPALRH